MSDVATPEVSAGLPSLAVERATLPNGLRVVVQPDPRIPLVAIDLWYHVGSRNERPGRTGFAHLFEHLLFEGSAHVGKTEHFGHVQRHGGVANGSTWFDRTNYYETLPSHVLELGLWLESDRLGFFEAGITQEKLDNQREVVKNERRHRYDNQPYGTWLERLIAGAYPEGHPYQWPVIGYMEDLDRATLDDVRDFFRTYYLPSNAVLVLAGDLEPERAFRLAESWFGEIPAGSPPPPVPEPPPPVAGEVRLEVRESVRLPRLFALYHMPALDQHGYHGGDLLSTLMSSGRSSPLHRSLVYEQQVAKDVQTFVLPLELTGQLHIQATCREGVSPETLENALERELDRLRNEGPTEAELEQALNRTEMDYADRLATLAERADLLAYFTTHFDDPSRINQEPEIYRSLTRRDLHDLAGDILAPTNRVVAWFLPEEKPA